MKKYCGCCDQHLDVEKFNKNPTKRDGLQSNCRGCQNARQREWYEKNKDKHKAATRAVTVKLGDVNFERLHEYLLAHPCVDCGEADPVVLQCDHLRDKNANVSQMMYQYKWEVIEKEIEKCEVRCANCHIRKTAKQFKFRRNNW